MPFTPEHWRWCTPTPEPPPLRLRRPTASARFTYALTALLLTVLAGVVRASHGSGRVRALSYALTTAVGAQVLAGLLNVALRVPVWMQLVHLLLADLLWITLVLLACELTRSRAAAPSASVRADAGDAALHGA